MGVDQDKNVDIEKIAKAIELKLDDNGSKNVKIISKLSPLVVKLLKLLALKQIKL